MFVSKLDALTHIDTETSGTLLFVTDFIQPPSQLTAVAVVVNHSCALLASNTNFVGSVCLSLRVSVRDSSQLKGI